ncbi:MAG: ATP-binding protein [candidate division Zixibacteria bacterium]|nr:ATP-binding protein [candidate division Zixibacteria bacterium]
MKTPAITPDGIIIPSAGAFLAAVDQRLEEILVTAGIDSSTIADIAISVSELVNNAIVHGNRSDPAKTVTVHVKISEDEVRVTVTDQGKGFAPEAVPSPIADDNLLREVGRGLFIVKNFVDEVNVATLPAGGTRVEIAKRRENRAS